nr:heat shock 70 kDa protein 15-like [Ipomoea batatas]
MALQDRIMEETKDKKNAVEAYVYDMRKFVVESEKEQLIAKLQEVEDWLYEDGEDETKGVYIAKLEELKKVSSFSLLCRPIMTKPKPAKPTTTEPSSPQTSQSSEKHSQGGEGPNPNENTNAGEAGAEATSATEPMETDKSESESAPSGV